MLGTSGSVKDAVDWPTNLQYTSECERERSEQEKEEDLTWEVRNNPDKADGDTDVLEASNGDEDSSDQPKVAQDTLERVKKCLEQGKEKNSPREALDKLDDPGDEMDIPGDFHSIKEHPREDQDRGIDMRNTLCRDAWP